MRSRLLNDNEDPDAELVLPIQLKRLLLCPASVRTGVNRGASFAGG